ncbi:hypothetical protein K0M31_016920 [Melipona bicolor]|uniref:Uncharacterized protein n=1 Tax=Melipona bicolor TaxID=60889 RepID=A0AA40FE18_9HYME|nr:hypothetical protein K0M31_016920 [Melipona bicolor]
MRKLDKKEKNEQEITFGITWGDWVQWNADLVRGVKRCVPAYVRWRHYSVCYFLQPRTMKSRQPNALECYFPDFMKE